ncbi:MAG: hypothetical protein V1723_03935 [Candidatus Uhrbacteria bacterium]
MADEIMRNTFEEPPTFESIKTRLLAEFPRERIEGLDIERVENFIRQEGLEVKPFIIFDRKDLPKVRKVVGATNLLRSVFNNNEGGLYSPEMDLALVVRDEPLEKLNGAIYTEGLLVHELAHASSMYRGYVTTDYQNFYTPRVGFCLPQNQIPWGRLLEEGWAEMHRADYFAQYVPDEEKKKLESVLDEFGSSNMEDTIPIKASTGKMLPVPIKYVYIIPEGGPIKGGPTIRPSAYAGYALELLCKKDPAIKSLLIEARSSVEGLRRLAQAIERIEPGLYKTLQAGDYTKTGLEEVFSEKLATVISSIAGGIENAIIARDRLRRRWDGLLRKW